MKDPEHGFSLTTPIAFQVHIQEVQTAQLRKRDQTVGASAMKGS
jgi:hypothetical protein